jgi:hypothetical protein
MRTRIRKSLAPFILLGLAVTVCLVLLSPWASDSPDGLNKVAEEQGFSAIEDRQALDGSPLSGYSVDGVQDERLSKALSGIIGIAITFTVAGGAFALVRRARVREGSN